MELPFTNFKLTGFSGCLLMIPALLFVGVAGVIGQQFYDEISPYIIIIATLAVLGVIVSYGNSANKTHADDTKKYKDLQEELKLITAKYNANISDMEASYKKELKGLSGVTKIVQQSTIRSNYSNKYTINRKAYEKEREQYQKVWKATHGDFKLKNIWQMLFFIGFVLILGACSFSMGTITEPVDPATEITPLMESRTWSAENIPMPHMTDGSQYVSNPDSILSQNVVDSINVVLRQIDDQFDIESAMIIVGHIENDDPIAMVRGVYQKYGVGKNNRGLVIVVGYLDHSYFIAPGRALEGDLTDLESDQLARTYLIPSMKAEQPDSGMLYLARGTYALFAKKDMPVMSSLTNTYSGQEDEEDTESIIILLIFSVLLGGWAFYAGSMSRKLGFTSTAQSRLRSNPFIDYTTAAVAAGSVFGSSRSSSHSSGGWGGGGGSHFGGGYGGGSWGGGGAGGRW
jgi:uncharacterized membrane protein YgcG